MTERNVKNMAASQWTAFLRNGRLTDTPTRFAETVESVRVFLQPVAEKLAASQAFLDKWSPGGPWRDSGGLHKLVGPVASNL